MSASDSAALGAQAATDAAAALAEDIGSGDLSAGLLTEQDNIMRIGVVYGREAAVLCGRRWFESCFLQLDAAATFQWQLADGDVISPGSPGSGVEIGRVQARARALLSGERSALNFLQTLSATATAARKLQERVGGKVKITDTRKTIPKLRVAQKYAVRIGGAHNHRQGLFDEILIKENHITAAGGIAVALRRARELADDDNIQTEVRTLAELAEALAAGAGRILLDNFTVEQAQQAVTLTAGGAELEVSGNIDEETAAAFAQTGIQRISSGALTKHIRAVDFSLILE